MLGQLIRIVLSVVVAVSAGAASAPAAPHGDEPRDRGAWGAVDVRPGLPLPPRTQQAPAGPRAAG